MAVNQCDLMASCDTALHESCWNTWLPKTLTSVQCHIIFMFWLCPAMVATSHSLGISYTLTRLLYSIFYILYSILRRPFLKPEPRGSSHGLDDYLDHIWKYLELVRAIESHLKQFQVLRCHLELFGAIWNHLELFWAIWTPWHSSKQI